MGPTEVSIATITVCTISLLMFVICLCFDDKCLIGTLNMSHIFFNGMFDFAKFILSFHLKK